jgi:mannitol/fructose-specific phosphotransferase system IIA component (Ntr-type)
LNFLDRVKVWRHNPDVWRTALTTENIHFVKNDTSSGIDAADKWQLIRSLHASLCLRENIPAELAADIERELLAREELMSTGIGEQMAIPHAVVNGAPRLMTECAILPNGINFQSIDGTPAYIVILLVAPKSALQEHLKVMASIAKTFYKPEIRERVIAAASAPEALKIIQAAIV